LKFGGHVDTGLDEQTLADLKNRFYVLQKVRCPFTEVPETNMLAICVQPELVAEAKFSECTQDGRLRIPVFLGLHEDKAPAKVRRTELLAASAADPTPVDHVKEVLEQLQKPGDSLVVEIEGNRIILGNLEKYYGLKPEAMRR
jgi:ATP-dependent DNA ligase